MNSQTVQITGTTCPACEKLITKRISGIPGVSSVSVDYHSGTTVIQSDNVLTADQIKQSLEGTHYGYQG